MLPYNRLVVTGPIAGGCDGDTVVAPGEVGTGVSLVIDPITRTLCPQHVFTARRISSILI